MWKLRVYQFASLAVLLLSTAPAWARAGGGSNSGGGGILQLVLLPILLLYSAYITRRLNQKSAECDKLLDGICARESGWDKDTLLGIARERFARIQQAWCAGDLDGIRAQTKDAVRVDFVHKMEALLHQGQRNHMDDLKVEELQLLNVQNYKDDEQDCFTVRVKATARDYTTSVETGAIVSANTGDSKKYKNPADVPARSFIEYWTFEREGNDWVLRELADASGWRAAVEKPLIDEGTSLDSAQALPSSWTATPTPLAH
jgi:hypothetical protein